jgi:hypothetical protein
MTYRNKLISLSATAGALALAFILGFIFEPNRAFSRGAMFSWLDPKLASRIDNISIEKPGEDDESIQLVRKDNKWLVNFNGLDYPARQLRITDFIGLFTRRASYPVRSNSGASHERMGLTRGSACRVKFSGLIGPPLLDLLIGYSEAHGQGVFMRKQGENEVRSGQDIFTSYTLSARTSWYNLRLILESEDGQLDVDKVQRLTMYPSAQNAGLSRQSIIFTRRGKEWAASGLNAEPDMDKINSFVRDLLYMEGDDFVYGADDAVLDDMQFVLELGTGTVKTIRFGASLDEDGRRYATVSGSSLVYSVPGWMADRAVKDAASFER